MIQMRIQMREWTVLSKGADADVTGRRTQKTVWSKCPFCGDTVKLYLWSLAGAGKNCRCGAKFESGGRCWNLIEQDQQEPSREGSK